jgi:hypothetical protein
MNTQIRENFIADLKKFPKYEKRFEKFIKDRGINDHDQVDFINDPEAFKFLSLKIYSRKVEINNSEYNIRIEESITS